MVSFKSDKKRPLPKKKNTGNLIDDNRAYLHVLKKKIFEARDEVMALKEECFELVRHNASHPSTEKEIHDIVVDMHAVLEHIRDLYAAAVEAAAAVDDHTKILMDAEKKNIESTGSNYAKILRGFTKLNQK